MSDSDEPTMGRRGLFGELGKFFAAGYRQGVAEPAKDDAIAQPQLDRRAVMQSMAAMAGQAGMPINVGKLALPAALAPAELIKTLVADMEALSQLPFHMMALKADSHGGFVTLDMAKTFSKEVRKVAESLGRLTVYRDYYSQVEDEFLRERIESGFDFKWARETGKASMETVRSWHTTLNPAEGLSIDFKDAVQPGQFGKILAGLQSTVQQVASQVRSAALCDKMDKLREAFDPGAEERYFTLDEVMEGKIPESFEERLGFLRAKKMWESNISDDLLGGHKARWVIEAGKHARATEALDEVEQKLRALPGVHALRIGRLISASIDTDSKQIGEKALPRADVQAAGMFLDHLVSQIEESAAMPHYERTPARA